MVVPFGGSFMPSPEANGLRASYRDKLAEFQKPEAQET